MIGKLTKCCFYFTEDDDGYERVQEEEEDVFPGDELDFDVRHFIDSDDANKGEGSVDNSCKDQATSASREIEEEEMDPDELEEKLKKLEEVFCCLPKVLIKRILCRDDVKGDMEIASQRLQEFQDMENPEDLFKAPMTPNIQLPKNLQGAEEISKRPVVNLTQKSVPRKATGVEWVRLNSKFKGKKRGDEEKTKTTEMQIKCWGSKMKSKNSPSGEETVSTKMKNKWMEANSIAIKIQGDEEALEEGKEEDQDPGGDIEAVLFRIKEINKKTGAMACKRIGVLVVKVTIIRVSLKEDVGTGAVEGIHQRSNPNPLEDREG